MLWNFALICKLIPHFSPSSLPRRFLRVVSSQVLNNFFSSAKTVGWAFCRSFFSAGSHTNRTNTPGISRHPCDRRTSNAPCERSSRVSHYAAYASKVCSGNPASPGQRAAECRSPRNDFSSEALTPVRLAIDWVKSNEMQLC